MAKKEGIRRLFDNIATDYDRLNHILSLNIDRIWRKKAVKEIVDTTSSLQVLDVACGTCDFAMEIAGKTAEGSKVTGIDLSAGMLKIGKEKTESAGLDIGLIQGDCEAMPFGNDTFDRISVGFGVRNFENLDKGLEEMYRVLKNGGKTVILELSVPSSAVIRWLYKLYFLNILPAIGGWISGDRGAYEYLTASVLRFPSPARFIEMMESAGFTEVKHKSLTSGICRMYIGTKKKAADLV